MSGQDSVSGCRNPAVNGVLGFAVEAQQRLHFGANRGRHLMPRVVLLALRRRPVGQLAEEDDRVRVHVPFERYQACDGHYKREILPAGRL